MSSRTISNGNLASIDFDKEPSYMTYARRRAGDLCFTEDLESVRRQLHANRGKQFGLWKREKGTLDYKLVFILDQSFPLPPLPELDKFIRDALDLHHDNTTASK